MDPQMQIPVCFPLVLPVDPDVVQAITDAGGNADEFTSISLPMLNFQVLPVQGPNGTPVYLLVPTLAAVPGDAFADDVFSSILALDGHPTSNRLASGVVSGRLQMIVRKDILAPVADSPLILRG